MSRVYIVRLAIARAALWLLMWAMGAPATGLAADTTYTVKRGDTVYGIARRHGVSAAAVAERNGLNRNFHIYAGQRLRIPTRAAAPAKKAATKKPAPSALPRSVQRAIDKAPVRAGRWKSIVIHHSGTDTGTARTMDRYHREVRRMENGLAYHFVIGNGNGMGDGAIAIGQRWTRQLDGGHLASAAQNKTAIGICLVGNFDKRPPSPKAMTSLRLLVEALMTRCRLTPTAVKTHQQVNVRHTRCPGARFPTQSFLKSLPTPKR
ncbi:MAG TPA: N-acetylmuramoyl-L-alanine amidase [Verrucomicrobiota bacterium]|nr:N-acetylmuramoyl-L-alanine amidase [Verrucomicrobiota bacterium]